MVTFFSKLIGLRVEKNQLTSQLELGAFMPTTGEINQKLGLYKTIC
jgi:hypothetical protein